MRRQRWISICTMSLLLFAIGSAGFGQTASTPEERARLVALSHKLESNPLDPSLRSEREWALKWLIEVPDIHVNVCASVLGDYFKYKYSSEINIQLTFSSAAFAIEHPDKAGDQLAQYVAGAEGALKAYSAILQQTPRAKSKVLDDILQKQAQGQLKAFVEDAAAKGCRK
jgi:hypothetical protein